MRHALSWSSLVSLATSLSIVSFKSPSLVSYYIYVKIPHHPHQSTWTCSHVLQRHIYYAVSSPTLHFSPDRVAISHIIHHHGHNHHRQAPLPPIHPYDNLYSYSCGTADFIFFSSCPWPCCCSSHALNPGVFTNEFCRCLSWRQADKRL